MGCRRKHGFRSGFLLPMMAAGLLVLGSAATVVVVQKDNTAFWRPKTEALQDLSNVKNALVAYQRENHKLPCVAPRSNGGLPNGVEIASCATGASSGAQGTVRLNIGGGNFLRIGALPYMTLKMGANGGEDKWANRFTYAVIEKLTDPFQFTTGAGAITVQDNNGAAMLTNAAFVVFSHGADGKGAYTAKGGNLVKGCTATAGKDQANCNDTDAIFRTADSETVAGTNFYDDMIAWDIVDTYAQTINKPCVRATIGDASWDGGQCTNNTWTDMIDGASHVTNPINNTNTAAATGTVTLSCDNGTLVYAGGTCDAHCPAPLAGQTWANATTGCSGTPAGSLNHGANQSVSNVAAGRTGSVTVTCNDGSLVQSALVCNPNSCTGVAHNWGAGCTATSTTQNHGVALPLTDNSTAGGSTGTATVTCDHGTWNISAALCYANCNGQAHNWGAACTANSTTSAHGATPTINNTTPSYTGSNNLSCTNGVWSSTGSTCTFTPPNCSATSLGWGAGCSANPGAMTHGQTINGVNNSAPGYAGTGNFSCNAGTMSVVGVSCNAGCAAGNVNWAPGCQGAVGALAHGANTSVNNGQAGYTGSVTVTCNNGTLNQSSASCATSGCASEWLSWGSDCGETVAASPDGTCFHAVCLCDCMSMTATFTCTGGSWVSSNETSGFCFLGHTPVTLEDGSTVRIDELKAGDRVRGRDGVNTVKAVPTRKADEKIYSFNGDKAFVTGGHPFWTKDGWKAIDPSLTPTEKHSVETTKLEIGDELFLEDGGKLKIESIQSEDGNSRVVYNPMIDGDHTYYANALLVHNKNCTACDGTNGGLTPSACAPSGCAASQAVSWNTNCSGTTGAAMAHGANQSVTNTAGGYTGSVTATCNNGALTLSGGSCTADPPPGDPCEEDGQGTGCLITDISSCIGTPTASGLYCCAGCTPPGASCAVASKSWTVGGYTCSASTDSSVAHNALASATDSMNFRGSPVGTAQFRCNNGTLNASPEAGATCAPGSMCGANECEFYDSACGWMCLTDGEIFRENGVTSTCWSYQCDGATGIASQYQFHRTGCTSMCSR